ncbi:hypothetical protein KUM37_27795 [Streptomonospora sp. NEAU-YY374]|nr:hypothetical protein [Streptomonospora nanhaiensis]MBV2367104.1 hypothetical protein [Streptomonospora nanhaiensis]MBX9386819.1 hypothetical protein [Streptomonospora nanhaiensis]
MCGSDIKNGDTTDIHLFDPGSLSTAQMMGDACAVCHVRWPRPRHPIGGSPEGGELYGCDECAGFLAEQDDHLLEHALVAH